MSEPTVELPARLVLTASMHLYHLAEFVPSHKDQIEDISKRLSDTIAEQCTDAEINCAIVASEIEMSK